MSFGEKLKQLRGGKTQTEFARLIGIDRTKINKYESGVHAPSVDVLQKIHEAIGININWFFDDSAEINETVKESEGHSLAPVISFADCGSPASTWYQGANKYFDAGDIKNLHTPFVLVARGDSMRPYINPYDKLLCADVGLERIKNKHAVIVVFKSPPETIEANAKLILKRKDHCILYSVNTMYEPVEVKYTEIQKIYKLIRIIREVK